jgi:hypothetical protein
MTTSYNIPENFLTRYNTTSESCECPSLKYHPEIPCKHIKVFNDNSVYDSCMQPLMPAATPPPGWYSYYTYRIAQEFQYYREDVLEYIASINKTKLETSHRVRLSELDQYHRYRINLYNTTRNSCECPSLKYHPEIPCKHMVYFRENHKSNIFNTSNPILINDIEEFNRQKEIFEKEKEEYAEKLDLCYICYTGKNIHVCSACKTNGICIDCYKEMESKKKFGSTKCPYCRTPLPNIVDFLVEKFKNLSK